MPILEPKEKDLLSIHKNEPYDLVVVLATEKESEYLDILNAVMQSSDFELTEDRSIEDLANFYVYKSEDQVLALLKALVPNNDGRFFQLIFVYSRKDYDKGYRIR
jgi:tryptophan 2,3-dioxygenase